MGGITIIQSQTLKIWEQKLINIEQNQLAKMKLIQQNLIGHIQSNFPDFTSIIKAAKKFNISRATIHNKIKLFENLKGRKINRLQMGSSNLDNEIELLEALRIITPTPVIFQTKKNP
jgi:hypothetical protein